MIFDENFTFDTPRSPSLDSNVTRETSRSVSPCTAGNTTTTAYPAPRFSVTDLAASFASSRLRQDSQICYDPCEAYANMDGDDAGWEIPGANDDYSYSAMSRTRTLPQRPHSPSRRMARQVSTRLMCSTAHAKDVAALVSRMVDSKEHCTVVDAAAYPPAESIQQSMQAMNEDEGYDSESGRSAAASRRSSLAVQRSRLDYRRTSDFKTAGGARVCKASRQRKEIKHRRVRSEGE